jgi:UDP-GlcNAc:undecaprenyl-phosphate/decaprenyl-phosphate GlcNAc-1-phosphate transferase
MGELEWRAAAVAGGFAFAALFGPSAYALLRHIGQTRANFRGELIPTSAGILLALPALALFTLIPALPKLQRADLVQAATAVGFCLLGFLDDRWGTPEFKGLRGHLRALSRGRITTGLLKAVGGVGIAAAAAAQFHTGATVLAAALAIALSANAFNLLDLRPLRALKVFWPASLLFIAVLPITHALTLGASLPYSGAEGRRKVMLGDAGANLLGAVTGTTAAMTLPGYGLWILAAILALLHLRAEKHSLTAWIAGRSWATAVDNWGVDRTDQSDLTECKRRNERQGDDCASDARSTDG